MVRRLARLDVEELLAGASIAVVGNAQSILTTNQGGAIDAHDIVVRLNRGTPRPEIAAAIGRKTTVVAGTFFRSLQSLEPRQVWHMSPRGRERVTAMTGLAVWLYPLDWWNELRSRLGSRPSSGLMVVDMLVRHFSTRPSVFGFDGWSSPTWYSGEARPGPHDPVKESAYLEALLT